MSNDKADLIYKFWRWEYLRRNIDYIEVYQLFESLLKAVDANKIPYRIIGSAQAKELVKIDVEKWIEALPGDPLVKSSFLLIWREVSETFKIRIPLPPDTGVDSKNVLDAHIQAHVKNEAVEYHKLVSGLICHDRFSFSIRDPEKTEPYDLSPEEHWVLQRSSRFEAQFANDHPEIKIDLPKVDEAGIIQRGNRFFAAGTPESIMVKDKKILTAEEHLSKSGSVRQMVEAIRNRDREALRIEGRRIKTNNLLRAVGLYLWDRKRESGALSAAVIYKFYEDFQDLPEKFYQLDQGPELRKLVKQTDCCIKARNVLPMR